MSIATWISSQTTPTTTTSARHLAELFVTTFCSFRREFSSGTTRAAPRGSWVTTLPPEHTLWHVFVRVTSVPQLGHIGYWKRGVSVERGEDSPETPLQALVTPRGHVAVVLTHTPTSVIPGSRSTTGRSSRPPRARGSASV